jgi:hypothetical protein
MYDSRMPAVEFASFVDVARSIAGSYAPAEATNPVAAG